MSVRIPETRGKNIHVGRHPWVSPVGGRVTVYEERKGEKDRCLWHRVLPPADLERLFQPSICRADGNSEHQVLWE